jgi:fused signal recognition particle receptor|tara:strand:+ start:2497 stop:3411 length:915 start_codon:yes stop_codon:yes gene_type:complete
MVFSSLDKLFGSLKRTRETLSSGLKNLKGKKISAESIEELETVLLIADLGVYCTDEIINKLKKCSNKSILLEMLRNELLEMITVMDEENSLQTNRKARAIMIVGVNGTGKTTSVAKLAAYYSNLGKSVMLIGADTYRAAAAEQLRQWSVTANIQFVSNESSGDPSAVLFDGLKSAQAKEIDISLIDTAGRLHTYKNLMAEIEKMHRVVSRKFPDFQLETLLTLDANLGQNSLIQARKFHEQVPVDGIILTKMDGTAKGGIVFPIYKELGIPVKFIGIGETLDDLVKYNAEDYVNSLLYDGENKE